MPFEHNCNKTTCDHQPTAEETADEWNLNFKIDLEHLQCLNEQVDGSVRKVFRNWDDRLDRQHFVRSDADQELLINIPYVLYLNCKFFYF